MQKESPVAQVRHDPEVAMPGPRGRSAHAVVPLTFARRT